MLLVERVGAHAEGAAPLTVSYIHILTYIHTSVSVRAVLEDRRRKAHGEEIASRFKQLMVAAQAKARQIHTYILHTYIHILG